MSDEEELLKKVHGESAKETLMEASEEGVVARARKVEAVPSKKLRITIWITQCSEVGAHIA